MPAAPRRAGAALWHAATSLPALALAIAVTTKPADHLVPVDGLDPAWRNALLMAREQDLVFGQDFTYTFGPLGWLQFSLVTGSGEGLLAWVYGVGVVALAAALLLWALRRLLGSLLLAVPAAYLACALVTTEPAYFHVLPSLAPALAGAVFAFRPDRPSWAAPALIFGGGFFAGLEATGKLNTGFTIAVIVGLAVAFMPGGGARALATTTLVALGSFLLLWLLAGQPLGAVDDYVGTGLETARGYPAAMGRTSPDLDWHYPAALLCVALTLVLAWRGTEALPGRSRGGLLLLLAVASLLLAKNALSRHDPTHASYFLPILLAGAAMLHVTRRDRLTALAVLALLLVTATGMRELGLGTLVDPVARAKHAGSGLRNALDGDRRRAALESARAALRREYDLGPEAQAALREGSVHVYPWEVNVAWAYELDWNPLPAIQIHQAYTPKLDELNADRLASPDGPERILRGAPAATTVDGRWPAWEGPRQMVELLCRYRPLVADARWLVLARGRYRCSEETRELGSATARYGEAIPLPRGRPDELVLARVEGLEARGFERLVALFARPDARAVRFGADGPFGRVVPALTPRGVLLRVPDELDHPGPFALDPGADTMSFEVSDDSLPGNEIELEFYALRMRPGR